MVTLAIALSLFRIGLVGGRMPHLRRPMISEGKDAIVKCQRMRGVASPRVFRSVRYDPLPAR